MTPHRRFEPVDQGPPRVQTLERQSVSRVDGNETIKFSAERSQGLPQVEWLQNWPQWPEFIGKLGLGNPKHRGTINIFGRFSFSFAALRQNQYPMTLPQHPIDDVIRVYSTTSAFNDVWIVFVLPKNIQFQLTSAATPKASN